MPHVHSPHPAVSASWDCLILDGRLEGTQIFLTECFAVQNGLSGLDWDLLEAIGLERLCPPIRPRRGLLGGWP